MPFSLRARRLLARLDERLKLILVAALVGVFGGLASVALNLGLRHGGEALEALRGDWYGFLFPAAGAVLSVVLLRKVFHDVGGHGVPEVIYSISRRGGLLRLRSSIARLLSCLATIASGGSAGPEAPVVISGASLGSNIAVALRLRDRQRSLIVGSGAAAAIGAIFNAPVTGIVFTLEAILGEWTPVNLVPIAIASLVGTEVSRVLQGNQIPFRHRSFDVSGLDFVACLGLAILAAASAVVLVRLLRRTGSTARRLVRPLWLRAACGGALVGAIGLWFPSVLGDGYGTIRTVIEGGFGSGVSLVALLLVAKIVATSITLGSGGSGGTFAPSLVIGCFSGLFYRRALAALFPGVAWAGEGYFALLGMAGVVSGVLQAPMTGMFLIMEITGGYDVLLSVALVAVLSSTLSRFLEPFSVYHRQLIERGELLRPRTDARILSELDVTELLESDCIVVQPEMRLRELVRIVERSHRNYFPVEDSSTGRFVGMVELDDARPFLFDARLRDSLVVEEIMTANPLTVSPEDDLVEVLRKFDENRSWSLPVVEEGRYLGLISKATLLDHYRRELVSQEEH